MSLFVILMVPFALVSGQGRRNDGSNGSTAVMFLEVVHGFCHFWSEKTNLRQFMDFLQRHW